MEKKNQDEQREQIQLFLEHRFAAAGIFCSEVVRQSGSRLYQLYYPQRYFLLNHRIHSYNSFIISALLSANICFTYHRIISTSFFVLQYFNSFSQRSITTLAYSETNWTFDRDFCQDSFNGFQSFIFFAKSSTSDIWLAAECTSGNRFQKKTRLETDLGLQYPRWSALCIFTKCSILDVAAALDLRSWAKCYCIQSKVHMFKAQVGSLL